MSRSALMIAGAMLAGAGMAEGALVHQFRAADYFDGSGGTNPPALWTPAVGTLTLSNAGAVSTRPQLIANATPTGQPAVRFARDNGIAGDGGRFLGFDSALGAAFTSAPDFTIALVIRNQSAAAGHFGQVISGNQAGDLNLRINSDTAGGQFNLSRYNATDIGTSTFIVPKSEFAVVMVSYNTTSGAWAFYRDGVLGGSGTSVGQTFGVPDLVGTNAGIGNSFAGLIAEMRFYNSSSENIAAITTNLRNTYIPEPASLSVIALGGAMLLRRRRA